MRTTTGKALLRKALVVAFTFALVACGDDDDDDQPTIDAGGGFDGAAGDSSLPVCPDPLEPNDDQATATALAVSAATPQVTASATIDAPNEDWFGFSVPKNDPVRATLTYTVSTADPTDLNLTLYDTAGVEIVNNLDARVGTTEVAELWWNGDTTAQYGLAVWGGSDACVGYTLEVDAAACTDADEDNDDQVEAADLELGTTVNRTIRSADDDWFGFQVTRNDPVKATLSYTVDVADATDLSLTLYDAAGVEVANNLDARVGTTEAVELWWNGDATIQYGLAVWGGAGTCAAYALDVDPDACTDADEDNETIAEAAPLALGASIERTAWRADDDVYAVAIPGSGPRTVTLTYTVAAGDSTDLSMTIYDAAGTEIANNLDARTGTTETATVTFDPTGGGTYYIDVWGGSETCVTYSLQAS